MLSIIADILENEDGDLLLALNLPEGNPGVSPHLAVKNDSAILYRAEQQTLQIKNVHPDIREKLATADEIMITEVSDGGIVNAYYVPVGTRSIN